MKADGTPGAGDDPRARLLELGLFSELRPGPKKALLRFAEIRRFRMKEEFIRQDEFTGDFYVVLDGLVTAYRREPDGRSEALDQLGPGDWFGELSALANQPSLAKLQADSAGLLAVLDNGLFKELYKAGGRFQREIDDAYRRRSLAQHLRVVPLLRDLDRDARRALREVARFETFEAGATLLEPDDPVDAIYLVRSGAITRHAPREPGSEPRLEGYLATNSSFGEEALLGATRAADATFSAMMRSDVLVLPIAQVRAALQSSPGTLEKLERAAKLIAAEDAGIDTGFFDASPTAGPVNVQELETMVDRQSVKGGEALVIDLEKCVRCNACVESCVAVHEDGVPRLSKKGNRVHAENNALRKEISLTTSCYHCETPSCMLSCSYGAIRRDAQGLIRFVWDNCVGCAMCMEACPYDVIRLTRPPGEEDERLGSSGFLASLPIIGGILAPKAKQRTQGERTGYHKDIDAKGKAVKCDRCAGLPFEACVYNCPCGAIERIPPAQVFEGVAAFAAKKSGAERTGA